MNYTSIILSGLPASGKTTLAKRLSEHWGWPIHSLGQIWRDQWKEKYPQAEISFEGYWRQTSLEDNISINQKAKEIFRKGAVIGESRYSIYCDDIPSLSLFITAPLETRASRSADKYLDTSFFERKKILAGREKDEVERGKQIFEEYYDYRNPQYYHLVLNSQFLQPGQEFEVARSLIEK